MASKTFFAAVLMLVFAAALASAQEAPAPAPVPTAGAYSLPVSGAAVAASLVLSALALLKH